MKSVKTIMLLFCSIVSCYSYAQGQSIDPPSALSTESEACDTACNCGSTQTPVGIMTDHIHPKGEWMLSYSYMDMHMRGNRSGTTDANDDVVYQNYMMAPATMNMQMHMAMLMYGVTDRLTLMAMGGYAVTSMSMNMSSNMMSMPGMVMTGGNMTMYSTASGFTDTRLSALYNFSRAANRRFIGSMGISLPTGSIHTMGVTMLGENQRQPYNMQPGTGSLSVQPGITYIRQYTALSLGADIKLNKNSLGYRFGNVYHVTAWVGYRLLPFVSASVRADIIRTNKISGSDKLMDVYIYQQNDPTTVTANYGGAVSRIYGGLNFHFTGGILDKFNMLAEYGTPLYQNLNGIQMSSHYSLNAGLQYKF